MLQGKRDLSRVLALALMRFDACPAKSQATGPSVLPAVSVSKRRATLSSLPLLPLSLSQLPSTPLLCPIVKTATTTKNTSRDRDDVTLKCSITALDENSLFSDERTLDTHSTAFYRNQRIQRSSRPVLFMVLLALLLEMHGCYWSVAGAETALNLSTKILGESKSGVVEEHPYNEYTWELNQLNPWLSACDLAGPAPTDLQGSCGPPEVPKNCPAACRILHKRGNNLNLFDDVIKSLGYIGNTTSIRWETQRNKLLNIGTKGRTIAPEQCLFYLEESHKQEVCQEGFGQTSSWSFISSRENRYWFMSGLRLRHCCEHVAVNALAPGKGGPFEAVLNGGRGCVKAVEKLLLVDALAARLHCEFEEVLARYDCGQPYSVIYNCTHCKKAYRQWVCSSLVPYFAHGGPLNFEPLEESWIGRRLRPCRSLCQSVEQRCPYLLPGDRAPAYPTQYAGEPTFLCRDPNIPETGEQAVRALHPNSEDECCFKVCSEEKPELGICADCLGRKSKINSKYHDTSKAPQCEVIASFSDQEQMQPAQQQLSLCGNGGIGSMIANENSIFVDSLESSLIPESSNESFLSSTTNSVIMSSSSASMIKFPSLPFLCLFWIWGFLVYSQFLIHCLFWITSIIDYYFKTIYSSYTRIIQLFLIKFNSSLNIYPQYACLNDTNYVRGRYCFLIKHSASQNMITSSIIVTKNGFVKAERSLCKGYQFYYHYCYRRWLWPSRWKNYFIQNKSSLEKICCISRYYYRWYYWQWLWPYKWKTKGLRFSLMRNIFTHL